MFPRAQLIAALLLLIAVAGAGSSYHRHNAFVTVFHNAQAVAVIGMVLAMVAGALAPRPPRRARMLVLSAMPPALAARGCRPTVVLLC